MTIQTTPHIRAHKALAAITTHRKVYGRANHPHDHPLEPDRPYEIASLMADLHHLADQLDLPWKELNTFAKEIYKDDLVANGTPKKE